MIYFLFKETTQKSLEDIDLLFGGPALGVAEEIAGTQEHGEGTEKEAGIAVSNVEITSDMDVARSDCEDKAGY